MKTAVDVLVIGAGQAGLSAAYHLSRSGLSFQVVDEETGAGGAWRHRWPTLTMATVNGIKELPGMNVPKADLATPARVALPRYFAEYERQFAIDVARPERINRVRDDPAYPSRLIATTASGVDISARALINATGTWTQPFIPRYPGAIDFLGHQWHTRDYPGPEAFRGSRAVVIGGGISAVQLLMEIAPVTDDQIWVTRREPVWNSTEFTEEFGRRAVAMVADRVSRGLSPASVVSVTGLPLTAATRAARAAGVLERQVMFDHILPQGVQWADDRTYPADILLWCTGFRPALRHLAELHLRGPGGGIVMAGTQVAADARIHLIGYGPSASTIGANRAGRSAVSALRKLLGG